MIIINRNIPQTTASDKFIYTTLFLYADVVESVVDGMTVGDFDTNSLPPEAQDFVLTYYSVNNGLRHLIIKSVVGGDYIGAIDKSNNLQFHYLCLDVFDTPTVVEVSNYVADKNTLFVGLDIGGTAELINNKNTYLIGVASNITNAWLWDDESFVFWDDESPVGLE